MQVRTASSELACGIYHYPSRAADDAHQLPLCQYRAATNAGPLRYMLHAPNSLLGQLRYKTSSVHLLARGIVTTDH